MYKTLIMFGEPTVHTDFVAPRRTVEAPEKPRFKLLAGGKK